MPIPPPPAPLLSSREGPAVGIMADSAAKVGVSDHHAGAAKMLTVAKPSSVWPAVFRGKIMSRIVAITATIKITQVNQG